MDGFTKLPKMQHFKEGGFALKQTPKILAKQAAKDMVAAPSTKAKSVSAAVAAPKEKSEKVALTLKKGGRAKKAVGTVKKFKSGGNVTNVYEAKKSSGDKDNIRKTKDIKPAKAAAPSKAATKSNFKGSDVAKEKGKSAGDKDKIKKVTPTGDKKANAKSGAKGPDAYKCGGKIKKYSGKDDSYVDVKDPQKLTDKIAREENEADARIIPDAYNAVKSFGKSAIGAAKKLFSGQGTISDEERKAVTKKKGGKIRKFADGGFTSEEKSWLGGADATDPIILARMRAAMGDKKPAAVKPQGTYIPADVDNRDIGQTGGSIDDESKWGNVSPAAAAFNNNIPGAGMSTPAAAPSAPVRSALPAGPSADDRLRSKYGRPVQAPNVEQDSGVAYPQGRDAVSSLRNSILPNFGGGSSLPSAFPAQKVAPRPAQTIPSAGVSMPSAFPTSKVAPRPAQTIPSANMAPMSLEESLRRKRAAAPVVAQKRGGKAGKKGC